MMFQLMIQSYVSTTPYDVTSKIENDISINDTIQNRE